MVLRTDTAVRANSTGQIVLGVLSDTHGRLPASALAALAGCDAIVHAGDVGAPAVIEDLSRIAPVFAVRGNTDRYEGSDRLARIEILEFGPAAVYVIHDILEMDIDPAAAGFHLVVHGHTHRASAVRKNGVMILNPGSASQPRYGQEASIARAVLRGTEVEVDFVRLPY